MKKFAILALLVGAIGFVGCDGEGEENGKEPQQKGYFSFELTDLTASSAVLTLTASTELPGDWGWNFVEGKMSNLDSQAVEEMLREEYEWYLELVEATAAEFPYSRYILQYYALKAGTTDVYESDGELSPATTYTVWACGIDIDGKPFAVQSWEFTTPEGTGGGDNEVFVVTKDEPYSNLTSSVSFASEEAYMEEYGNYWDDCGMASLDGHESFWIELYGPYEGENYSYVCLDLLAPAGATTPEGTYTVGYSGQYIALSSVYVDCGPNEEGFYAGSYYGYSSDSDNAPYADFESGTVTITKSGNGYKVVVDVKSGTHSIKTTYTGVIDTSDYDIMLRRADLPTDTQRHYKPIGRERKRR